MKRATSAKWSKKSFKTNSWKCLADTFHVFSPFFAQFLNFSTKHCLPLSPESFICLKPIFPNPDPAALSNIWPGSVYIVLDQPVFSLKKSASNPIINAQYQHNSELSLHCFIFDDVHIIAWLRGPCKGCKLETMCNNKKHCHWVFSLKSYPEQACK